MAAGIVILAALISGFYTHDLVGKSYVKKEAGISRSIISDDDKYLKKNKYEQEDDYYYQKTYPAYQQDYTARNYNQERSDYRYYDTSKEQTRTQAAKRDHYETNEVKASSNEIKYDPWRGEPILSQEVFDYVKSIAYNENRRTIRLIGPFDPRTGEKIKDYPW